MAGRFEGLSDLEWKLFEAVMTEEGEKRGRGMSHAPFRCILNTLIKFISIKSLVAKGLYAPGNCAGHNRFPSLDHGYLPSIGECGL